jgi:nucleoside-diphosphate-sugar epimerase
MEDSKSDTAVYHVIKPKLAPCKPGMDRILITGGAGFIGSHLARKLLEFGHQVVALDNLLCSTKENLKDLQDNENFEFYQIDVSQPFDIEGPLTSVVHLASAPSPAFYYTKPRETLYAGLHGTKNSLDLALKKGARYLFSSSSEVYGDPEVSPQSESYPGRVNPIGKRSQYDQSKRGGETLIKLYFERYGMDTRIVRIFNTYGTYMDISDGRVVTSFIKSLMHDEPMIIHGDGLQSRSFGYVTDTVDGIVKVLTCEKVTAFASIEERVFNIGNPCEFTINELAQKIDVVAQKYLHKKAYVKYVEQPDPGDPKMRKPDITHARVITGYNPTVSLEEGLEKTVLFFLSSARESE